MTTLLELQGVGRVYPGTPPTRALAGCELRLRSGEFLTIAGPSGSGKSTLLNILGLLDRPTSGRYLLHGEDLTDADESVRAAARARHIGFVFQSFHLLEHRTALENTMLATLYRGESSRRGRAAALGALDAVGLAAKAETLVNRLSGGERQRIAIARALAGRPTLLLADEPTGNLDTANGDTILQLFRQLNTEGATIVLITHDPRIAAAGSARLTIRDGIVTKTSHAG